jgi:flagellar motility protein MotE (MotC chaperone)
MIMASKGKRILGIIILLIIIILLPIIIFGSIYFLNEDFKLEANRVLRGAPGPIGNYFESMPTELEKQRDIKKIADYYLSIDKNAAVDKLEKIKVQDEALYDNIIKYMVRDNPNRTKDVLDVIRRNELNEDLITSTISEINEDINESYSEDANELLNLSLPLAKEGMEEIIGSSLNGHLLLSEILKNLSDENIASLITLLDDEDFSAVLNSFSKAQQESIKKIISNERTNENDLNSIIEVYKSKNAETLAKLLNQESEYTFDELVYIYENLGPKLAGQVLAKVNTEEFTIRLTNRIKENQILKTGSDELTKDILKSLKLFTEFDDNINELTQMYNTMDSQQVSNILEGMMRSSVLPEIYQFDNGETLELSDEDVAIEILNNFNTNKRSEVISLMTDAMASQVSRKLSLPRDY